MCIELILSVSADQKMRARTRKWVCERPECHLDLLELEYQPDEVRNLNERRVQESSA